MSFLIPSVPVSCGCRREVREETGLEVTAGRLVAVDTRPSKADGRILSLIHISEPTRLSLVSRMPSSA